MTPDPDAPPAAETGLTALPEKDLRAVEAAVAGVAGLLIGRALLGRAGGLAAGLAALGAGLLGKRPPPAAARPAPEAPSSNGHAPPPVAEGTMRVRLQTSPVPPVDAVAALAAAGSGIPLALAAAPAAEERILYPLEVSGPSAAPASPPSVPEEEHPAAPPPRPEVEPEIRQAVEAAMARLTELALAHDAAARAATAPVPPPGLTNGTAEAPPAESPEDAGAFAEMPALFEPLAPAAPQSAAAAAGAVSGLPVTALLERAENELGAVPAPGPALSPPDTSTPPPPQVAPASRTAPVPSLLEAFPVEFAELKAEEEPGPREEFLLIPEGAPPPLPPLEPVVAALEASIAPRELQEKEPEGLSFAAVSNEPGGAAAEPAPPAPAALDAPPAPEAEIAALKSAEAAPLPETVPDMVTDTAPLAAAAPPSAVLTAPVFASPVAEESLELTPARHAAVPVRPIPLKPPAALTDSPAVPGTAPVRPLPAADATESAAAAAPPWTQTAPAPEIPVAVVPATAAPAPQTPAAIPDTSAESPFCIWEKAAALQPPAAATAMPEPDEIWRQAAAEQPPAPSSATAAIFPPPVPAPSDTGAPPFPVISEPAPITAPVEPVPATSSLPPWLHQTPAAPASVPPWLQNTTTPPAKPEPKPFLPTIRLAVPQAPQSLTPRAPRPEETAAAPVALPGYRAEPLPPLPAPVAPIPAVPAAAVPAPAVSQPASTTPAAAELEELESLSDHAPIPAFSAATNSAAHPPEKIYVERREVRRLSDHRAARRPLLTPGRVGALAVLAGILLIFAFKPQLVRFWEERIQGRLPRPAPPVSGPVAPAPPADAPDVKIAPDKVDPAPAAGPAPAPPAASPGSPDAAEPPGPDTSDPQIPAPPDSGAPDSEPLPAPPPPPAPEDDPATPLPVDETGAAQLIGRLLYATSADQVLPNILNADKLKPALEEYFSSGRMVPVATHQAELERTEVIPGTSRKSWFFRVTTDSVATGFPVLVEETSDGLRADWEIVRQCRDGALRKFVADPAAPPAAFYTGLQRRHVFADMLPGQDHTKFLAFAISSPVLQEPAIYAFIPRSAPLAARAEAIYRFGGPPHAPVLELTHRDGLVEITAILRENWRVPEKR